MKLYFLLTTVFLLTILLSNAQVKVTRKIHKISDSSKFYIEYSFDEKSKDELPLPRDNDQQMPELVYQSLNSDSILNNITGQIFTGQQAKYLADNKCYLSCVVSSEGEIHKVIVVFLGNHDPEVNTNQLNELIHQVKKNLKFELTFNSKVVQKGFIVLNHPTFPSLMINK